ncbi:32246_t:CDS:2, partial [Racocetra persica]
KWNFISPTNIDLKGAEATLKRFANYPASTIKDEILSRLVYEIGIQGRAFKNLTKASYKDISLNLNRISNDFQSYKSNLEKEQYSLHQEISIIKYRSKSEKTGAIKM